MYIYIRFGPLFTPVVDAHTKSGIIILSTRPFCSEMVIWIYSRFGWENGASLSGFQLTEISVEF